MINSLSEVFEKQSINVDPEYRNQKNFFNENGYCVIEKSNLPIAKFADIIDLLIEKEGWRGGWEGKEE